MCNSMSKNTNIANGMDELFMNNSNVHKYALLWASRFYTLLNNIMGNISHEVIINDYPNTLYFIKNYINYFGEYGVYKKDLEVLNIKQLYRGVSNNFIVQNININNCFISTTWKHYVAQKFANHLGSIMIFKVDDLPSNIPFVVIDDLNEGEIVFLPGNITSNNADILIPRFTNMLKHVYISKYKPNKKLIQLYIDTQIGGKIKKQLYNNIQILENEIYTKRLVNNKRDNTYTNFILSQLSPYLNEIPNISLAGKQIVFYRAIKGRDIDVLDRLDIPNREDEIYNFFNIRVKQCEEIFTNITNLMPEVKELRKILTDKEKLGSYNIYMAIYNKKSNIVEEVYYGIFKFMYSELYININRIDEIISTILNTNITYNIYI